MLGTILSLIFHIFYIYIHAACIHHSSPKKKRPREGMIKNDTNAKKSTKIVFKILDYA